MTALRAKAYLRVSTLKQAEEGMSLEAQEEKIAAVCAAEGWELVEVVAEAKTGDRGREKLEALFADLDSFDKLIIAKVDRFGRNFAQSVELKDRLDRAGKDLVCLDPRIDFGTNVGQLVWANLLAVAQMERANIGERVAATSELNRKAGKLQGGHETFGLRWKRDGESGIEVVRDEAPVVLRWFTEYAAGGTANSIARGLDRDGIRTRSGGKWKPQALSKRLADPKYKGAVAYKGEIVAEDAHEAIVPPDLWDRVAALRAARRSRRGGGRGRPPKADQLFAGGALKCGECGAPMYTRTYRHGRGVYFCKGRDEFGPDHCSQGAIDAVTIDAAATDYFLNIAHDTEATRRQFEEVVALRLSEARALSSQAEGAVQRLHALAAKLDRDYGSGDLSAATFDRLSTQTAEELTGAEEEAKRHRRRLAEVEAGAEVGDAEAEMLAWLSELRAAVGGEVRDTDSLASLRAALTRLFDGFRFVPNPSPLAVEFEPGELQIGAARLEPILKPTAWPVEVELTATFERIGLAAPTKNELSGCRGRRRGRSGRPRSSPRRCPGAPRSSPHIAPPARSSVAAPIPEAAAPRSPPAPAPRPRR
jgi:site-specific DNA recombinase